MRKHLRAFIRFPEGTGEADNRYEAPFSDFLRHTPLTIAGNGRKIKGVAFGQAARERRKGVSDRMDGDPYSTPEPIGSALTAD